MKYNAPNSNPFSQSDEGITPEAPPMEEILRQFVANQMANLRVSFPAKITQVVGNQQVHVQPLLQNTLIDNTVETLPVIQNCMVWMPQGKNYSIKLPLAVDDVGWCLVCDRSLDVYAYSTGVPVDPQDTRAHDITDAIFFPGGPPFGMQTKDATTDLVLTNGKAQAKIQDSGKFVFKNDSNELITILDKVLDQLIKLNDTLSKDTVNTIFGPMQLNDFETYATIKTDVTDLQTKLKTLKGG